MQHFIDKREKKAPEEGTTTIFTCKFRRFFIRFFCAFFCSIEFKAEQWSILYIKAAANNNLNVQYNYDMSARSSSSNQLRLKERWIFLTLDNQMFHSLLTQSEKESANVVERESGSIISMHLGNQFQICLSFERATSSILSMYRYTMYDRLHAITLALADWALNIVGWYQVHALMIAMLFSSNTSSGCRQTHTFQINWFPCHAHFGCVVFFQTFFIGLPNSSFSNLMSIACDHFNHNILVTIFGQKRLEFCNKRCCIVIVISKKKWIHEIFESP